MHCRQFLWLFPGLMLGAQVVADEDNGPPSGEAIAGYVEPVTVHPEGLRLNARMDTGAQTSSIHAPDPEPFEADGEDWVRFSVADDAGEEVTFERKVERTAIIRQASGGTEERYVVKLGLCVRDVFREVEVNLSDREGMSHPLLVGRNFLEGHILVDSSVSELHDPACRVPEDFE